MKCDDCGEKLTERIGDAEMDEGGVKVKLEGVRIFTCPKCKRAMHTIPKMEALFREEKQRSTALLGPLTGRVGAYDLFYELAMLTENTRELVVCGGHGRVKYASKS